MKKALSVVGIIIIALLSFLVRPCFSVDYFVDYGGGSDSNSGTSISTPWKHCPGDTNAGGLAASTTPFAGDSVVFRGGVTYAFSGGVSRFIEIKSSGSIGNPVTYMSGHVYSTPWPNKAERAIIDGSNITSDSRAMGIVSIYNKTYVTIKGLEIKNQPINGNYGCIGMNGWYWGNIIVEDCVLHHTNGAAVMVHGMWDAGPAPGPLNIRKSELYDSWGHLVFMRYGTDYVTIENNKFDRNGSDPYGNGNVGANAISLSYGGTNMHNHTVIRKNDINQSLPAGVSTKSHILLQHTCQNLVIEQNYFHGTPAVCAIDHTGPIANETIRNNVFHDYPTQFEGILRYWTDQGTGVRGDGIKIYNNTFVSTPRYGAIIYFYKGNSADSVLYTNVDIRNNIFDTGSTDKQVIYVGSNSSSSGPVVELSTFTCDHNAYNAGGNPKPFAAWSSGGVSFESWKALTSVDAASAVGSVTFVDRSSAKFGLHTNDTLARGKGVTIAGFSKDINDVDRPEGSWDIGAYQGTGFVLNSPTGLTLSSGQ